MSRWSVGLGIAALATIGLAAPVRAQQRSYVRPYELNLHAGAFVPDSPGEDTDGMLGGRILANLLSGWSFGARFDWVPRSDNANTYLYGGTLEYTIPASGALHAFLAGGLGAATTKLDHAPAGFDDTHTDLLLPLGGGIKWYNQPADPAWILRGDVRDDLIWVDDGQGGTDATNNWEFSGGISILLGE